MTAEPHTGKNDLPSISVRRPVLAIVMNLLIVVAGISAFLGVEVRELPNVDKPIVTIRYDFPGASPATIDSDVTRVLEGAVARVPGVRCYLFAGLGDRLANPDQARDLWEHWGRPHVRWYHGSHVSFVWESEVKELLLEALRSQGLLTHSPA